MKVKLTGDKKGLDAIGEITYMVGGVPIEMEIEREEVEDDIQPDDFINSLARKYFDFELVERKHDDMQWYVYVACISKNDKISLLFGSTYNLDKVFRKLIKDYELVEFSLIPDSSNNNQGIIQNATEKEADLCLYGCGCFWFRK